MERIPRGRYTKEFSSEAVKLATEGGISVPEVARRLLIPKNTLDNWLRAKKSGKLGEVGKNERQISEIERELMAVKRELALTKMERDILKSSRVFCEGVAVRYAMVKALRLSHPVPLESFA